MIGMRLPCAFPLHRLLDGAYFWCERTSTLWDHVLDGGQNNQTLSSYESSNVLFAGEDAAVCCTRDLSDGSSLMNPILESSTDMEVKLPS